MKKKFCLIGIFITVFCFYYVFAGSIYSMYNDKKAYTTDDILTVIIVESAKAGSESGTSTNKKNNISLQAQAGTGALSFLPAMGASAGNGVDYGGKAGTTRSGNLVAKISARVVKVLDNGNLVIDGSKVVEINDEKEIIKISGIVRPQDIEANNTIYSYNIADAQITYSGKGVVHTGERPGLIARILNWIF
jgi:flagellar L-ring protein precursor FlgH